MVKPTRSQGELAHVNAHAYSPGTRDIGAAIDDSSTSDKLILGGDYAQGGSRNDIGCFAVVPLLTPEPKLQTQLYQAIRRHVPKVRKADVPELHALELWSGQKRAKSRYRSLSTVRDVQCLLFQLARSIHEEVPFICVGVSQVLTAESRPLLGKRLITEATADVNDLLALGWGLRIARSPMYLDAGDKMRLLLRGERGQQARLVAEHADMRGRVTSEPIPQYVDSSNHSIVQVADLAAFSVLRLLSSIDRLESLGPNPKDVADHNFWLEMVTRMNINVKLCQVTENEAPKPSWAVAAAPPGLEIIAQLLREHSELIPTSSLPLIEVETGNHRLINPARINPRIV